ncbi:MAG TPA: acetylornithine deacetylase [Alphaproteobacteria bacterium]|nr:acetylornithine deacetylase [Alphaproteobacteria bacterium]
MDQAIAILERLIGFPTVSAQSNLAAIQWIRDYLADLGIASHLVPAPDGQPKANLWATIGPDRPGGIVLSGHTDVVPVEGQPWTSAPFELHRRDGKLYGRGTCDMKGFIALALALVPEMLERPLKTPIHLAFSYDEELGCLGAPSMIAELGRRFPKPSLAIIGEPTSMRLGTRHKGCYSFETEVTGRDAHSSQTHKGANAIAAAAAIVGELERIAEELRERGRQDANFEPPYSTINVGRIGGGTAINIIARHCEVQWDFRATPGDDPALLVLPRLERFVAEQVLPKLRRVAPEAAIVTRPRVRVPPLTEEKDGAAEALVKFLTGANETIGMAFATEAGQFQEAGLSAIVCGPGSIAQAHQPDEFIEISQMEAGQIFLRKLVAWAREN